MFVPCSNFDIIETLLIVFVQTKIMFLRDHPILNLKTNLNTVYFYGLKLHACVVHVRYHAFIVLEPREY